MSFEILFNSLTHLEVILLIVCCFLGSAITTTIGMGGGALVIAGMSLVLPINALIPIHAFVQGVAGINRAIIFRKHVLRLFFILFISGSIIGLTIAANLLVTLSEDNLKLFLGSGLLILNFLPRFKIYKLPKRTVFFTGFSTGFLTIFVGVMGPILAIFLNSFEKERVAIVGTVAWCISFQNISKAVIFSNVGFDYTPWLVLIVILVLVSYLGTILGKKLLAKSNNEVFKKVLKIVIFILAIKLIIESFI